MWLKDSRCSVFGLFRCTIPCILPSSVDMFAVLRPFRGLRLKIKLKIKTNLSLNQFFEPEESFSASVDDTDETTSTTSRAVKAILINFIFLSFYFQTKPNS